MKKLIALVLALVCVLALAGCDDTAEIQIDKIIMTYSTNGDKSSDKVTITDKETISELLAMHNSLQTVEKSRPLGDERIWVIFYMGDNVEIEWCISAYGNDLDNAEFISCSTLWSAGNHKIKSNFDYNRVVEIFNSNCYFDSGSDLAAQFPHFMAKILEIHDNYLLVEPEVGMEELKSADKFEIPLDDVDNPTELQVDDSILIVYDGEILETYPAKLGEVYSVGKMIIIPVETKSTYTYEELSEMPANELLDLFIQNGLVINDDLKASFTEEELQTLFKENFHLWHTGVSAHSYTAYIDLAEQTKAIYDKIAEPSPLQNELSEIPGGTTHVVDIWDQTTREQIACASALEKFWEDETNEYYFGCIKSHYIMVMDSTGRIVDVVTALEEGLINIETLDSYGIKYDTKPKS